MSVKVSIIMPIYNAEQFLEKRLSAAVNQTLNYIEIICVNDGSKDNSLGIMEKYQERDSRIKIVDKVNAGYGHAMNIGLANASGEYIAILEPDDFVELDMYENLYQVARSNVLDVVKSNFYKYKAGKDEYYEVLFEQDYNVITSAWERERIIVMQPSIWTAIYKREFLETNGIRFNETPGAAYQDTSFNFKVWVLAKRVMFVKDAYLHYRLDNENSSVNSSGKVFSICDEFYTMESFLKSNLEYKNKFSKILQVEKWDAYKWNLSRVSEEFKSVFEETIAIELIKARYEGVLDSKYFDDMRWYDISRIINDYSNKFGLISEHESSKNMHDDTKKSILFRVGRIVISILRKMKKLLRK